MKILIAENDPISRRVLEAYLLECDRCRVLTSCCPNRFLTILMSFSYFANVYPIEIITTEFSLLMSYMQFCLIIGFGQQPVE